jgi:hypothetical protein
MTSLRLRSRVAWTPVVLVLPFLMGADGKGCQAGGDIPVGAGEDSGLVQESGSRPAADACVALPCVPCPYGSTGIGKDANGCETCPICAPPDAGRTTDGCTTIYDCAAPNCMYGLLLAPPQKDANGCDVSCPICAPPPPDAGPCQCGPPPPVAACPDGSARVVSCEPFATSSCSWVVGPCPAPPDGGGSVCASDADCPAGNVCGFYESDATGCRAAGSCFPAPAVICNVFSPGCACDGSEVNTICNGLPTGYARKALKHTGACVDGG